MKAKDELLEIFEENSFMVENFHNKKMKILRSDNGGVFGNERLDKYLAALAIQKQLTVPEITQHNGLSERLYQTLINITRCFLIESGADHRFWAEASATAAYLHNKRPSAVINGNFPVIFRDRFRKKNRSSQGLQMQRLEQAQLHQCSC